MTSDDPDPWQAYWNRVHEGSRRLQVERAAADPISRWLVADATALVDEEQIDLDPRTVQEEPDAVVAAAREGFAAFVASTDLEGAPDTEWYQALPIHLTTVGRVDGVDFSMADPVADAGTLTTLDGVRVLEEPTRRHEAVAVTYRCPVGHERSLRQPLLRNWTVDSCLEPGCGNDVVPVDAATRARRVVRFVVEGPRGRLPCIATGQYGHADAFDRLVSATALHLSGITRLVVDEEGVVGSTYEVLAAEPA